ncbi:serine kinase [Pelagerythrobacter rhizovicinus]|uniref:Serine kinase n=1 Tax=Pelagerythrobacter rhizovicinus TaxID=2268576 RepID=A0A4Q2KRZ0_9SPHN|nr:serine kinase [Pelagerythrobacter rhizovicinus]
MPRPQPAGSDTVASLSERLLHQATCVAIGGRAVLIEGPPGAGKSGLALALIDRGAVLVGDDGVALERRGDALWSRPPANIRGMLEARNLGLLTFPTTEAPVALRLVLDPDAPRFVEAAARAMIAGVPIPSLRFDPRIAPAPMRAELALRTYGLPGVSGGLPADRNHR